MTFEPERDYEAKHALFKDPVPDDLFSQEHLATMSQGIRLDSSFADNCNSSESPTMAVIPHMTMCVRPRRGINELDMMATFCLAHIEQVPTFLLHILIQSRSIFGLCQMYLDNVSPLLKIIRTPSLQGRIIEAASNVTNINPTLEALMFSIYCTLF